MKKLTIMILFLFLLGCRDTAVVKPSHKKVEEKVEIEKVVVIPYVEQTTLKALIKDCNKVTNVIELELLHDRMIDSLLGQVDLDKDLESQSDIIEAIIQEKLDEWRMDVVEAVVKESGLTLHEDDVATLVMRTSVKDAYYFMLAYEKIFLREYAQ